MHLDRRRSYTRELIGMALGALLGAELDYCWGATGLILEHALGTAMHLTDARSGTRRDGALGAVQRAARSSAR
jgi:hypothetical protein